MRKIMVSSLVGLGVFLVVAAAMIKFYAYPKLALAPLDQDSKTSLSATDATVFDVRSNFLREVKADLEVVSTTRGDVKASDEASNDLGKEVRVWFGTQTVTDTDGIIRSQSVDSTAFDAHTSAAVNCCDNFAEEEAGVREPVDRKGIVYKFPFATEKKTYEWWDGEIGDTVEMEFVEETDIDGLEVYKFEGDIPATVVGTRDVPASVAGEPGTKDVTTDTVYANKRTFWIEPHTGVIIDRTEAQRSTLEIDGEERVIMTEADLAYTDEQVRTNVDDWRSKAMLLGLLEGFVPWLLGLVGLMLIVGGFFFFRRMTAGSPSDGSATRRREKVAV